MSLFSDSEGSNSSVDQSMVFGSTRVQPNSPTPYTDATQVSLPGLQLLCTWPHTATLPHCHTSLTTCPISTLPH